MKNRFFIYFFFYLYNWNKINIINKDISDIISGAAQQGKALDTSFIVSKLDDLYNDFYQYTPDPQHFQDLLQTSKSLFETAHGTTIPIDKAQKIKQTIYALNRKAYGDLKSIQIESNKALARGIREEIERVHPEIKALNAKDKSMIELEDAIESSIKRIDKRDIVGIGTTIAATAGASVTASPVGGFTAGMVRWAMDHPKLKAALGIAINKSRTRSFLKPGSTSKRLTMEEISQLMKEQQSQMPGD